VERRPIQYADTTDAAFLRDGLRWVISVAGDGHQLLVHERSSLAEGESEHADESVRGRR
jgi:hypothetical protein